jgi:hypothetical protein
MTHEKIDQRSLALAAAVVTCIDHDPARAGLERARRTCARWRAAAPADRANQEWAVLLAGSWETVRTALLDPSPAGQQRRSNSPFCGVLPEVARREIFKQFCKP